MNAFYHFRRLILSYCYEAFAVFVSWAIRVKPRHYLVLYFSMACILAGMGFTLDPAWGASFFGFENLNIIALTDVRAYYGTMLIALGIALASLADKDGGAAAALIIIIAFSLGSALGRLLGFFDGAPLMSIHGLLFPCEVGVSWWAFLILKKPVIERAPELPVLNPATPEDFKPLTQQNFVNPYKYYKMLRDDYPVYKMPEQDFYMVSRYQDIIDLAKDTDSLSSKLVEIIVTGKPKSPEKTGPSIIEKVGEWGVIPVDVFALQDPPVHTEERKVGHAGFNAKFVKSLEEEVELLCSEMLDELMPRGNMEFVQEFAWRLPMRLIIRLLGLPESDFEQIKAWCVDGIKSLSGTASKAELVGIGVSAAQFMRYLWKHYLYIKSHPDEYPENCFTVKLARLADDPESVMTDQKVIATLLQFLIAGSDSSASSMGSAVRKLAEDPEMEALLRKNPERIPDFIEEVFRTESAFQGHFRVTKKAVKLHDIELPPATRVFLMWASGNRDERFWDDPDTFNIDRKFLKKHLTFGHGVHACLGRELARMEIRVVLRQLLERTTRLEIVGETPYEASVFARTMVALPLAFELA